VAAAASPPAFDPAIGHRAGLALDRRARVSDDFRIFGDSVYGPVRLHFLGGDRMPDSRSAVECRGILSIWNDMDVEHQDFYEQWYMNEHFPERLGVPGFRRGRRYEAVEADRKYFSFYELDSPDVLFSEAYLSRLNAPTAWTQRIMSVWKGMFRTVCERLERQGRALGGSVVVARWEVPAALKPGTAGRIREGIADPSVVAVDVWRASERQNAATQESQKRGTLDRMITAAVVVEATRLANAAKVVKLLPGMLSDLPAPSSIGLYQLIAIQDSEA
jgi:hypothetical protein